MKRFLALVLVLVLAIGFASIASAETQKRTVTFWHCMGGTIGEAVQANVDAFNASQDEIFVDAQYQGGYDDALIKVKAAVPAGEGPDVFQMFEMATSYLADVDWVVPFSDLLEKDPYMSLDDIEGAMRNYYTVDGKFMCLPFNPSSPIMYYNKDAFDAAGITEIPTTFEGIAAIAEQLTSVEGNPEYAMGLTIYGWFFEAMLVNAGYYYVNNENGRAATATAIEYDTNGGGKLVMEAWKKLVDDGVAFNFGVDNDGAKAAFMAGTTAITLESTAQLTTITNGSSFNVGTAFFPSAASERTDRAIIGGGNLWMVNTGDEQRMADAWTFMKFMASAEPAATFSMATGYYAANSHAYEVPEYVEFLANNPNASTALDQLRSSELNNLTGSLFTGVNAELRQIWQEEMDLYLQGAYTIDEALAEIADRSNASIASYNATVGA